MRLVCEGCAVEPGDRGEGRARVQTRAEVASDEVGVVEVSHAEVPCHRGPARCRIRVPQMVGNHKSDGVAYFEVLGCAAGRVGVAEPPDSGGRLSDQTNRVSMRSCTTSTRLP